ncbi:MAG: hypothetical protein Q8J92_06060 [Parvibaculum sp.]|nr:hypothetical protein [Parvibaculum sp.]
MADKKRLVALSEYLARGTGDEGCDLLQAATVRWLQTDTVEYPSPNAALVFLRGAMFSVRYNRLRQLRLQRSQIGERLVPATPDAMDPVENIADQTNSTEDEMFVQQLFDLLDDDLELQAYLLGRLSRATRTDMKSDNNWDDKKYDAVQKRFNRMISKLQSEGALP